MIKDSAPSAEIATAGVVDRAIEVDSLKKTYTEGSIFRKKFEALKGITFEVNKGEIFGLLGPNGAGKTTFLKILLGIIRKTDGDAKLLGFPAGSRQGRKLVGYLPEHLRVPGHLTGYSVLECYGNLSNVPNRVIRDKRDELLELVGLTGWASQSVKKYSKGMLQRLGLAQALLHDPQLLVLDEPTDGLDPRARAEMRDIIRKLKNRGVTIFLNSHLLQEVEIVCERVAILNRGVLRYCGTVNQIGKFVGELAGGEAAAVAAAGNRVELTIMGDDPDAINQCFQGLPFKILSNTGSQYVVSADTANQSEVDSLIDRLRQCHVSVIQLDRPRVSLEDAFLKIVDE
jgi:ABC-2 type transport system ATP-binding protein